MKLDIGCGKKYEMPGVHFILNVAKDAWPWEEGSVEEIHCSHFLEHLTAQERINFMNNAGRVLQPGCKMTIITPHWASNRAYGDPTHQWPPVAEMFYYYLKREWRESQAPHTDTKWNPQGYSCDFDATWGYSYSQELGLKHPEHVQFALQNYKEAAQDLHATLIKRA
jgi:hypothetical protein